MNELNLTDEQIDALKELMATPTPTGSEHAGMMVLAKRIMAKTSLRPTLDVHGNLHCVLDRGAKKTVMLEGHVDEIGFIVQHIDDDGLVYLSAVGGVTVPLMAAERVVIFGRGGKVYGVFGPRPPHLMTTEERRRVAPTELKNAPLDIGASNRAEAEALVAVGDLAVVDASWRNLAGSRVSCRGFDNRIGAFAMAEAFIRLATSPCGCGVNVHYVATVMEEIGLVGGHTAAFSVKPDIGICSDVTFATDVNKEDRRTTGDIRLGRGASVARGPIYHKALTDRLLQAADAAKVPYQLKASPKGTGNNAWSMRLDAGGAAVALVSVPLRYMHSPVETIDLRDVASVIEIVAKGVGSLDDGFNLLPEQP